MDWLYSTARLVSRQDDECDGDKKDSAECQKPVSQDSLTIGLAVGLPAAAVIVILGYFLFRNYRKNKKEDLEHDPDFDENGEATALPDFPSLFGPRKFEMEDPFDNRNSIRYPPQHNQTRNDGTQSSTASLFQNGRGEKYVESFVLPYHHQIGSKVSLDEYARQLGGDGGAYAGTPRGSTYLNPLGLANHGTRNSSLSNINYVPKGPSVSPQKSNLKYEQKNQYENIPNHSFSEIHDTTEITDAGSNHSAGVGSDIEEVSNDSGSFEAKPAVPKFEINYENESDLKVNNAYNKGLNEPNGVNESTDTFNTTREFTEEFPKPSVDMDDSRDLNNPSPFHDDAQIKPQPIEDEHIDGDFDFSNESANVSAVNTVNNEQVEHNTANTSATNLDFKDGQEPRLPELELVPEPVEQDLGPEPVEQTLVPEPVEQDLGPQQKELGPDHVEEDLGEERDLASEENGFLGVGAPQGGRKSPRISAFNLLKNDSDEEDPEDYDEDKPIPLDKLSPEQEEELQRMKSVYKLYFDRDNSIKRKDSVKTSKTDEYEANYEFQADPNQPLPEVNMDQYLKINKNLQSDTDYGKRLTTTSSIYTDHDEGITQQQQYTQYLQDQNFQQFYQEHVQSLPPLQSLPHPSDIRKSTIQTYTDYQPRSKNSAASPPMKQPFNPIDSNTVWSPKMNNQGTFNSSDTLNQYATQPQLSPTVPSASQMARSSVVMLNPVTEITKQRKFKPAGSLPSSHSNNHVYAQNYNQPPQNYPPQNYNQNYQNYNPQMSPPNQQFYANPQDSSSGDLIPEGKGDVRRMMNSNF